MKRLCLLRERRSSASEAPLLRCADNRCVVQASAPLLRGMRRRCSPRRSGARITGESRRAAPERPGEIAQICGTQASYGAARALPADCAVQRPDGQGRLRRFAERRRVAERCAYYRRIAPCSARTARGDCADLRNAGALRSSACVLPADCAMQRPDGRGRLRRFAERGRVTERRAHYRRIAPCSARTAAGGLRRKSPGEERSCMEESVLPRGKAFPAYSVALAAFWMAA